MTPHAPPIELDPDDMRRPPRHAGRIPPGVIGLLVGLAAVAGWVWWSQQSPDVVARAPQPAPPAPAVEQPAPAAAPEEHIAEPVADGAPLQARDIPAALAQLLGRQAAAVQTDEFPRRFVATLDNLGRDHASPVLWPVVPTAGRFTVENGPDGQPVIAAANAQRYASFVGFATSIDSAAAVQVYARMLPLLQGAYGQLGFPGKSFNDRVLAVIDLLLAAPEPAQAPRVQLMEVKGPVPSTRPWVRYEFVDPRLEALPAGQKMLVRMGPANERRLKQKLRELRTALVQAAPSAR